MKALTLRQPFATLLMSGLKQFETRDWTTRYRGKLAIHAGASYDPADRACTEMLRGWSDLRPMLDDELPLGCVLGIVELVGVYRTHDVSPHISDMVKAMGNYQPGRAAWEVKVIDVFKEPVPAKGALGLWEWTV